ncbi:MAG TPA: S46 family peptidase, partial [Bacteroidales bacterium]|nr:S46 family peptidase [Bacteroidales bacterium]
SPDNIPLKPKYYLPVSLKGYKKGDFSMVMGYPGSTDRYMTSFEVKELMDIEHPNRIKIRGMKQKLMMEDMVASDAVRIMYASKYSRSSNYWKYSIGQTEGLKNLNVIARKKSLETAFTSWLSTNAEIKNKYGDALHLIEKGVKARKDLVSSQQYLFECMYQGMETVQFGLRFRKLFNELSKETPDSEVIQKLTDELKLQIDNFYKNYHLGTDKKISRAMLQLMLSDMPGQYQPTVVKEINTRYKGSTDKYLDRYYKKSILPYREKVEAFLSDPSAKVLEKDPGFRASMSFLSVYFAIRDQETDFDAKVEEGRRLWIEGLRQMKTDRKFYPDANSTLRLTYGTTGDYNPRDAVHYSYFTTLQGVMEKEDPGNPEFIVSDKLKQLYNDKDYGRYGENGIMHVCFTTNNDITGGNSGSPVLNANGELMGIAFDGNWEAMSGDIIFEPELQKCICVDIRYVLFVIDKYAGDTRLIDEMTLVE